VIGSVVLALGLGEGALVGLDDDVSFVGTEDDGDLEGPIVCSKIGEEVSLAVGLAMVGLWVERLGRVSS